VKLNKERKLLGKEKVIKELFRIFQFYKPSSTFRFRGGVHKFRDLK